MAKGWYTSPQSESYLVTDSRPELCPLALCRLHLCLARLLGGLVLFLLETFEFLLVGGRQLLVQLLVPGKVGFWNGFFAREDICSAARPLRPCGRRLLRAALPCGVEHAVNGVS